jgi:hypothetical protein
MIIFFNYIVHKVFAKTPPVVPSVRLFVGHRMSSSRIEDSTERSSSNQAIFENHLDNWIDNQAVPRLPSCEWPKMYSQNHYAGLYKNGIICTFGDSFNQKYVSKKQSKKTLADGTEIVVNYSLPNLTMKSLKEYNPKDMLPEYTDDDKLVLRPEPIN